MLKTWDLFWEAIAALLTNSKDAATNLGEGTVALTAAYKHGCQAIDKVVSEALVLEEV